jgi:DNA-binding IclR family transcriptional regulator
MTVDKLSGRSWDASRSASQSGGNPPQYRIESLDNALRLLLLFEDQQQVRLTEASHYLGVATSTAHRLLATLQFRGFVRQNRATRAYEPGPAPSSIALGIRRRFEVRAVARPYLQRLHHEFGETVHLGRLEGQNVIFVDAIEGSRAVRVASRAGRSLPAHATSSGKVVLSMMDDEALRSLYPDDHLPGLTRTTLTSVQALGAELVTVRERGYAVSNEESEDGVLSIAAPIVGTGGHVFAVNVSLPEHRMTRSLCKELIARTKAAADELSSVLI